MSPRAACRLETLGFTDVYEYRPGKEDWIGAGLPTTQAESAEPRIGSIVRRDVPTCRLDEPLATVKARVAEAGWEVCFVTSESGIVLGRLDRAQLDSDHRTAEAAMKLGPVTYRAHNPTAEFAHLMTEHRIRALPVTTSDGKLIGAVRLEDVEKSHAAGAHD